MIRKKERAIIENNPIQLAVACNSLGDWYHENQQYENALECYKEEAKAYEKLGKRLEKSRAHRMIGEICMLLEQFEDALKHELIYLSEYRIHCLCHHHLTIKTIVNIRNYNVLLHRHSC